jgi:hypothetical protein
MLINLSDTKLNAAIAVPTRKMDGMPSRRALRCQNPSVMTKVKPIKIC